MRGLPVKSSTLAKALEQKKRNEKNKKQTQSASKMTSSGKARHQNAKSSSGGKKKTSSSKSANPKINQLGARQTPFAEKKPNTQMTRAEQERRAATNSLSGYRYKATQDTVRRYADPKDFAKAAMAGKYKPLSETEKQTQQKAAAVQEQRRQAQQTYTRDHRAAERRSLVNVAKDVPGDINNAYLGFLRMGYGDTNNATAQNAQTALYYKTHPQEQQQDYKSAVDKHNEQVQKHMEQAQRDGVENWYRYGSMIGRTAAELPLYASPGLAPITMGLRAGESYNEAVDDGANRKDATKYALANAALSPLEYLGGGERVLSRLVGGKTKNAGNLVANVVKESAKGAVTETAEEEVQTVLNNITKYLYKDIPFYSNEEGEDAVINPKTMWDTAKAAGLLGALGGGGVTAIHGTIASQLAKKDARSDVQKAQDSITAMERQGKVSPELAEEGRRAVASVSEVQRIANIENADERANQAEEAVRRGTLSTMEALELLDDATENVNIKKTAQNELFVEIEEDVLDGVPQEDWIRTIRGVLKRRFPDGVRVKNQVIGINSDSRKELTSSKSSQHYGREVPEMFRDKLVSLNDADSLLAASNGYVNEPPNHDRKKPKADSFGRGKVLFRVGGNGYEAEVLTMIRPDGSATLYDILNMEPREINEKSQARDISVAADEQRPHRGHPNLTPSLYAENENMSTENLAEYDGDVEINDSFDEDFSDEDLIPADDDVVLADLFSEPAEPIAETKDVNAAFEELKEKWGTWSRGMAPKQLDSFRVFSQFLDNALAHIDDEEFNAKLREMALEGYFTHRVKSNNETINNAIDVIEAARNDGVDLSSDTYKDRIFMTGEEEVAAREIILAEALNKGDYRTAYSEMNRLSDLATAAGRTLQAFSILKKLTDSGMVSPIGAANYYKTNLEREFKRKHGFTTGEISGEVNSAMTMEMPNIVENALQRIEKTGDVGANVAAVLRDEIRNQNIDVLSMARNGDLGAMAAQFIKHAAESGRVNLDPESRMEAESLLSTALRDGIRNYRRNVLLNMKNNVSTSRGKKIFLDRLVELNDGDAFEDAGDFDTVLNSYGLTALSREDSQKIVELTGLAQLLREDPETEFEELAQYDTELTDKVLNLRDKYGAEHAERALYSMCEKIAAKERIVGLGEKLSTLQRISMMGNARTMIRNFLPNVVTVPVNTLAKASGTLADRRIAKKTGYRTQGMSLNPVPGVKSFAEGIGKARSDAKLGIDTSLGGTMADLNQNRLSGNDVFSDKTSAGRILNKANDEVSKWLAYGDRPFEEMYYNERLNELKRLNGAEEATDEMKTIAKQYAMERTWKDENGVTKLVDKGVKLLNGGRDFGIGSTLIPFRRTPANIFKAMFDYSPASLINIVRDLHSLNKAKPGSEEAHMAQYRLSNDIGKGIAGLALGSVVFALTKLGAVEINGSGDDYEDEDYEKNVLNQLPNSIKIGNYYIDISFSQPWSSIIISAANMAKGTEELFGRDAGADEYFDFLLNSVNDYADIALEQSFLDNLNSVIDDVKQYGMIQGVVRTLANIPSQFIPSLMSQFAQAMDPYQRQTYDPGSFAQSTVNSVIAKIPFLRNMLPQKYDTMGNPMESSNMEGNSFPERILSSFILPSRMKKENSSDVITEMERLEELGLIDGSLRPNQAPKSIEYGGKTIALSNEDVAEWNRVVGGQYNEAIAALLQSDAYQSLNDRQKAKTLKKVRENITGIYKEQFLADKGYVSSSNEYKKAQGAMDVGISMADYAATTAYLDAIEENYSALDVDMISSYKRVAIIDNDGLSSEQKYYMLRNAGLLSDSFQEKAIAIEDHYDIDMMSIVNAYTYITHFNETIKDKGARLDEITNWLAAREDLTKELKGQLYDAFADDNIFIPVDKIPDFAASGDELLASLKSDTFRSVWSSQGKNCGLTYEEFVWAYKQGNAGGMKKDEFCAAIDKLNLTAAQKTVIKNARNFKSGYSFHDGGSVEVQSAPTSVTADFDLGEEMEKLNEEAKGKVYYSNYRTEAEMQRRESTEAISKQMSVASPMSSGFRISSKFGKRKAPTAGASTNHDGVDLAPTGDGEAAATAVQGGKVIKRGWNGGYGNAVYIELPDGKVTFYAHLDSIDSNLQVGDTVKTGQQIGVVGSTGTSTGRHLHFGMHDENGNRLDPLAYYDFDGDGELATTAASDSYSGKSYGSSSSSSSGSSHGGGGGGRSSGGRTGHLASLIAHKKNNSYKKYGGYTGYAGYAGYSGYPGYRYDGYGGYKA